LNWKPMARFGQFDESLFTPFLIAIVHRFGHSVRKENHKVAGLMRKHAALITLWEQADHRTTGFQADHLPHTTADSENDGLVITGIHLGQLSCRRIVLGIKQRSVTIRR